MVAKSKKGPKEFMPFLEPLDPEDTPDAMKAKWLAAIAHIPQVDSDASHTPED
jgi:hypothetical protein